MKISRKADYGLRAIIILAGAPPDRPMQVQEMAAKGDIPLKFLEQILLTLKRGGLLRSKRGVGGGYHLDTPAHQVTIGEIIELIDGELCQIASHEIQSSGDFRGARGLRDSLDEIDQQVNERLQSVTIEQILNRDEPDAMLAFGI